MRQGFHKQNSKLGTWVIVKTMQFPQGSALTVASDIDATLLQRRYLKSAEWRELAVFCKGLHFSAKSFPRVCQQSFHRRNVLSSARCPKRHRIHSSLQGMDCDLDGIVDDDFVEVGLICSTHGVQGAVKVMPRTDFPKERFEQPGTRWIGFRRMDKLVGVRQVELISGQSVQGKHVYWLVKFQGVETLEKATGLLGATIFVKAEDRPALTADEFYIPDLVGMSVQLKGSGEVIGSIVDIFNSGASDLLRVKLFAADKEAAKDVLVWIPFAEEIVPVVDVHKRVIEIVPPKGLLELNVRSESTSKKELRRQALRTKRKIQEKIAGIKKRVTALKQEHILSALTCGDKIQKEALQMQLMGIDFKLFEHAVESALGGPKRFPTHEQYLSPPVDLPSIDWKGLKGWLSTSSRVLDWNNNVDEGTLNWWKSGLRLIAEGRLAVVALPTREQAEDDITSSLLSLNFQQQAKCLLSMQGLAELLSGEKTMIPWVVVSTEASEEVTENLFKDEAFFGLDEAQVFFVRLSSLPYVSRDAKEGFHKILMESQWRIKTGPGGEGQIISDLNDSGVLDDLIEIGVDYIHVCAADNSVIKKTDPVLFGVMDEQVASVGVMVTIQPLEDDHRILYLRETSPDANNTPNKIRKSSKSESEEIDEDGGKTAAISCESYIVLNPEDQELVGSSVQDDERALYRLVSLCNYTYSVEYLKDLSEQRYKFNFEAVSKRVVQEKETDGQLVEIDSGEDNAMQLKCSIHSALMFCLPSKVALLESDIADI